MTAPQHLSERCKGIWDAIVPRQAASPERQVLLQTALELLDRLDGVRRELDKAGSCTTKTLTTNTVHVHPLFKAECELRREFSKLWQSLHLGVDPFSFKGKGKP